jgi:hypothetical protein
MYSPNHIEDDLLANGGKTEIVTVLVAETVAVVVFVAVLV